ncbi:MAG: hypothetical protein JWN14_4373 [Chthonomonadales bacterium]|nr:hypothetical protein [Chthonomonadales bacterium]
MHRFLRIPQLLQAPYRVAYLFFLAVGVATLVNAPAAQAQVTTRGENAVFSATVTSVETSPGANGWHYLTTSVHLQNLTTKPLILGVEPSKVNATDDQHNSYGTIQVRGIGEVRGTTVDPKFVLPPDGGGDALFEMRWRGDRNAIFGTTFDLTMPVRVIQALEGGQYKIGTEHLMSFGGLKAGYVATPKGAPSRSNNSVDAGPFTMQVTRLTPSIAGRWHVATLAAQIRNTSDKPIVLAYEGSSSFGVDDQGNSYGYGTPGTHDTSVSGIGMLTGTSADPQFTLAPGESRDVQFKVVHARGREVAGKMLTYYVALAQLEVLPSKQIRTVRQYSLTFPRMSGLN